MNAGRKLAALAPLLLPLAACGGGPVPYSTTLGLLRPHETITVHIGSGTVNAYAPIAGDRADRFTVEAFATTASSAPPAPKIRSVRGGIDVDAPAVRSLLVRVPQGVNLVVFSRGGDVNVTDISGDANVTLANGNADLMLPAYGEASNTGRGSLKVIIGSSDWPGTLSFSNMRGDIDLSINENAKFRVHMHTGDGTIFTDFPLRGHSKGASETIDGLVNGGGPRRVDVEVKKGAIRLLSLAPQY